MNIRIILDNSRTELFGSNGVDYDLPRYATYDAWEADAAVCRLNNTDVPIALIEEYM